MDVGMQGHRRPKNRGQRQAAYQPELFDDTSRDMPQAYAPQFQDPQQVYMGGGYGQTPPPQGQEFAGQSYFNDPRATMAMHVTQNIADQGKNYISQNIEQIVPTSKLKYYFAVDTTYVCKKLGLLIFPYLHKDWSIRFNQDEPIAPRYEVNAPDLYIPVMAIVTYILLAGVVLGTHNSFTPEQLGIIASTALVWLVIEIGVLLLAMYIIRVSTDLKYYDLLAYCGYKYVGMILTLLGSLLFQQSGYYMALLWTSFSISFFLVRSLKMAIIPHNDNSDYSQSQGSKRRLYMLLVIALSQPLFMLFLTRKIV